MFSVHNHEHVAPRPGDHAGAGDPGGHLLQPPRHLLGGALPSPPRHQQLLPSQPRLRRPSCRLFCDDIQCDTRNFGQVSVTSNHGEKTSWALD